MVIVKLPDRQSGGRHARPPVSPINAARLASVRIAEHTELRIERRERKSEALVDQSHAAKAPAAALPNEF
jgi:hypothetical protein